ncbi:MAG: hypothetical protein CL760_11170 [Chloroflexi bacterium]|nr:hypothetical protein [Chloroflexota bacterium]|tara:strand:- start:8105 stop:8770 length:666 start_codon:yes stop_codon:yes gene_type:complete
MILQDKKTLRKRAKEIYLKIEKFERKTEYFVNDKVRKKIFEYIMKFASEPIKDYLLKLNAFDYLAIHNLNVAPDYAVIHSHFSNDKSYMFGDLFRDYESIESELKGAGRENEFLLEVIGSTKNKSDFDYCSSFVSTLTINEVDIYRSVEHLIDNQKLFKNLSSMTLQEIEAAVQKLKRDFTEEASIETRLVFIAFSRAIKEMISEEVLENASEWYELNYKT